MYNKKEIIEKKIFPLESLLRRVYQWKLMGEKVVFTNGCFDILHLGHLQYLLDTASLGNRLIVAVNSDSSVKKIKGDNRPIQNQQTRLLQLACHTYIDAVLLFEEETPLQIIEALQPDVLVKGGDYTEDTIIGASFVKSYGGIVSTIPITQGYSTSNIIHKIQEQTL